MFNVFKKPGKISGEDFDHVMKTDQITLDEQTAAVDRLSGAGPQGPTHPVTEKERGLFDDVVPTKVLPANAVIGGNVAVTPEGLKEIDPATAHELGADAIHGADIKRPE